MNKMDSLSQNLWMMQEKKIKHILFTCIKKTKQKPPKNQTGKCNSVNWQ